MEQDNLLRIQENLKAGHYRLSPAELADDIGVLSGEYSFYSSQLEEILMRRPQVWNSLRAGVKSDKACDRVFEATEDGMNDIGLRMRLKRIEVMLGGLKKLLRNLEGESINNH